MERAVNDVVLSLFFFLFSMTFHQPSEPRRIAMYIRVSTHEQKMDGYSPEAQRKRLLSYVQEAKSRDFVTKPEWIFEDTHTGSDLNRPQLQKLLTGVKRGRFDGVLVWRIDRFSRNLKHLLVIFELFEQQGVSFFSLQENIDFTGPFGKLIYHIFGAIAQFERELIKGRTRMGKLTSAEMGNFTGTHIPYGYQPVPNPGGRGKKLAIIPQEQKWIQQIYNWNIYHDMGYLAIAKRLRELRVPKGQYGQQRSRNTPWTEKLVENILNNPLYRGEYIANRKDENQKLLPPEEWTIVPVPPCVSEFTFQQAEEARRLRQHRGKPSDRYLLSGKLVDISLPQPRGFSGLQRSKGGISYRRTQFTDSNGHYHKSFEIPGKQLEEYVWGKILSALQNPEHFLRQYCRTQLTTPSEIDELQNHITALREHKSTIEHIEIPRIESAYERGVYETDKLQEKLTAKQSEMTAMEEKIIEIEDHLAILSHQSTEIKKLKHAAEQIEYRLEHLSHASKKILCQLFVDRIEMTRTKKTGSPKWNISAEIYFRFNPEKMSRNYSEVRTTEAREQAISGENCLGIGVAGQKRGTTYREFVFKIRFLSTLNKVTLEEESAIYRPRA